MEANIIFGILGLLCLAFLIGKKIYEKNPEFFEYWHHCKSDIKGWETWKSNQIPSIHARITNSLPKCKIY